ncbi:hypothetical protein FMM56_08320 [Campylobacter sp. LR264d]|uniref:hypothetical protein n=1 Tax=Campylobacter sp. LR264d TaxID=2593544 RepID=UPI00123C5586|nr:hypothetical protein [Campylobacter sp. LR264d]KAA6229540.1 hypothetical protein FMM56_08320 [Campylobacter sp. LR264d]
MNDEKAKNLLQIFTDLNAVLMDKNKFLHLKTLCKKDDKAKENLNELLRMVNEFSSKIQKQ